MARNLGDDYTYEMICQRILNNPYCKQVSNPVQKKPLILRLSGNLGHQRKIKGIRALYIQYCFKLGILPKEKPISEARLHFLLKEDLAKLDSINKETRLLCINKIDTSQQLFSYQSKQQERIQVLVIQRKHLRYKLRNIHDEAKKEEVKSEVSQLTLEIGKLRKEVVLCDNIAERSNVIKDKLKIVHQDERKEESRNEHRRRSSRSSY